MSFYNIATSTWSETEPKTVDIAKLKQQFPDCGIIVHSNGIIEIQRPVTLAEKTAFVLK